jgi:hypothetical protein
VDDFDWISCIPCNGILCALLYEFFFCKMCVYLLYFDKKRDIFYKNNNNESLRPQMIAIDDFSGEISLMGEI